MAANEQVKPHHVKRALLNINNYICALGIVINCGGVSGGPDTYTTGDGVVMPVPKGYLGGYYWNHPGAFRNGFQGFCAVFVTASFAFGGTELTGLAAAEARNPLKSIPKATRQVFWRITLICKCDGEEAPVSETFY